MNVVVERAERDDLLDLRRRVLTSGRRAAMSRDHRPDTGHWVARRGTEVIGCVSVMSLNGWVLRGMAVDPACQGRGVGRLMLEHVAEEVDAPMWCNARLAAVGFYEACGWVAVGPVFEIEGEGAHRRMVRYARHVSF